MGLHTVLKIVFKQRMLGNILTLSGNMLPKCQTSQKTMLALKDWCPKHGALHVYSLQSNQGCAALLSCEILSFLLCTVGKACCQFPRRWKGSSVMKPAHRSRESHLLRRLLPLVWKTKDDPADSSRRMPLGIKPHCPQHH